MIVFSELARELKLEVSYFNHRSRSCDFRLRRLWWWYVQRHPQIDDCTCVRAENPCAC